MQKLKFINSRNIKLDFTNGNFGVVDWKGLSDAPLNIQSQQVPFHDGSIYLDALLNDRTISITVALNDEGDLRKRYELRRELISKLNPKLGEGTLIYENDFLKKQIKAVAELPSFSNKNLDVQGTIKVSLNFDCCEPYWESTEEKTAILSKNERVIVSNDGDVPVQVRGYIDTLSITNPQVRNYTTDRFFKLNGTFNSPIRFDTNFGNKQFYSEATLYRLDNFITDVKSIAYSEDFKSYVAVGNGLIMRSVDGYNWDILNIDKNISGLDFIKIHYSKRLKSFFITSVAGSIENMLVSNDGGKSWRLIEIEFETQAIPKAIYEDTENIYIYTNDESFASSKDGINWEVNYTGHKSTLFSDVVKCGNKYYASIYSAYDEGGYAYSNIYVSDSIDFTNYTTFTPESGKGIVGLCSIDENEFIAYGWSGSIFRIRNSLDYEKIETGVTEIINDVIRTEGNFLAVGDNGTILFSENALTWDSKNSGINENYICCCYGTIDNKFILFGTNSLISSTTNFYSWNNTSLMGHGFNYASDILYCEEKGIYLTCYGHSDKNTPPYDNGYIMMSEDGISWSQVVYKHQGRIYRLYYDNIIGKFIALGNYGRRYENFTGMILTSDNGTDWEIFDDEMEMIYPHDCAWNDSVENHQIKVICETSMGLRWTRTVSSSNGTDWEISIYERVAVKGYSICYDSKNKKFLSLFDAGNYFYIVEWDDDYNNWWTRWIFEDISGSVWGLEYGNGLYVINSGSKFYMSTDLENWTPANYEGIKSGEPAGPSFTRHTLVKFFEKEKLFVYVDMSGNIYMSKDGMNWGLTTISGRLSGSTFNDGILYVSGSIIAHSTENVEDRKNLINHLDSNSDINFTLDVGDNELGLLLRKGDGYVKLIYREKFIGV